MLYMLVPVFFSTVLKAKTQLFFNSIFRCISYYVYDCFACLSVCVLHVWQCQWKTEEDVRAPGAGWLWATMWMLRNEGYSARTSALSCRVIASAPKAPFSRGQDITHIISSVSYWFRKNGDLIEGNFKVWQTEGTSVILSPCTAHYKSNVEGRTGFRIQKFFI